jgi:hypothetical protein
LFEGDDPKVGQKEARTAYRLLGRSESKTLNSAERSLQTKKLSGLVF